MAGYGLGEILEIRDISVSKAFDDLLGPQEEWDDLITKDNWASLTNEGNAILRTSEFRQVYESLLDRASAHMGLSSVIAQSSPTFRIQLPGTKSVSFHTDDISSGHGRSIANFWLPLRQVNQHNCLHLVPPSDSHLLLTALREDKLSLKELDHRARDLAKPALLEKGQMLCFSTKILHGTATNHSPNVRVSLDFRCLPTGADAGSRVIGKDFVDYPWSRSIEQGEHAISVVYQSHRSEHVGHGAQRAVVNDYAARSGFVIERETSEWHHLDHFPVLEEIMSEAPASPILIFSKLSIDWDTPGGAELIKALRNHPGGVHFCLENEKI